MKLLPDYFYLYKIHLPLISIKIFQLIAAPASQLEKLSDVICPSNGGYNKLKKNLTDSSKCNVQEYFSHIN